MGTIKTFNIMVLLNTNHQLLQILYESPCASGDSLWKPSPQAGLHPEAQTMYWFCSDSCGPWFYFGFSWHWQPCGVPPVPYGEINKHFQILLSNFAWISSTVCTSRCLWTSHRSMSCLVSEYKLCFQSQYVFLLQLFRPFTEVGPELVPKKAFLCPCGTPDVISQFMFVHFNTELQCAA